MQSPQLQQITVSLFCGGRYIDERQPTWLVGECTTYTLQALPSAWQTLEAPSDCPPEGCAKILEDNQWHVLPFVF